MAKEAATSAPWISTERVRERRPRAGGAAGTVASVIVVHPVARAEEREGREQRDDDEQDPGERRGIAHAEEAEGLLVEVERVEQRRVDRPARALADDEGRGERLERLDG